MSKLKTLIAKLIKKADSSYFFENYDKQSQAVIAGLKKQGYAVVPLKATEEMCEFAAKNMSTGRMRPEEHVGHVYKSMVEFASRQ